MKKILIALALFSSLSVSANQDAEVLGVAFGSTCEETVQKLNKDYGTPKSQSADKLVYLNEMFEGFKADRIELGFQDLQGTTKLNQARFYFVCPNKAAAIAKMKSLVKKMKTRYSVSYDEEDGGTAFYKGGNSPLGIGCLFTIFVSPYQGKWTCQLRYGKFQFK